MAYRRRRSRHTGACSFCFKPLMSSLGVILAIGVLTYRVRNFLNILNDNADPVLITTKKLTMPPQVSVSTIKKLTAIKSTTTNTLTTKTKSKTTATAAPDTTNKNKNNKGGGLFSFFRKSDDTNKKSESSRPQTVADLPSDWNEILKLRAQSLTKKPQQRPKHSGQAQQQEFQQEQSRASLQQYQSQSQQPQQLLLPTPQLANNKNNQKQKEIILLRSDAIYQKGTWDKSPIIIEKYKLVFFTVPKVGCTAFKQLFRRMMGYTNWQDHQYYNEPFLPHNPATNGLKYLSNYDFDTANDMLTSPEWTRAIFIRDPRERVLSAFLDKAVYSKGYYLRMRCCEKFAAGSVEWTKLLQCGTGTKQYTPPAPGEVLTPIMTFEEFLGQIVPQCPDPHWEPQAIRMAPKYWERINFVGRFENVYEDTKTLLTQLGAWEEYGATGWTTREGRDGAIFDPSQAALHGTTAQDKESKDRYFTDNANQLILQQYDMDYNKFSFPQATDG